MSWRFLALPSSTTRHRFCSEEVGPGDCLPPRHHLAATSVGLLADTGTHVVDCRCFCAPKSAQLQGASGELTCRGCAPPHPNNPDMTPLQSHRHAEPNSRALLRCAGRGPPRLWAGPACEAGTEAADFTASSMGRHWGGGGSVASPLPGNPAVPPAQAPPWRHAPNAPPSCLSC